MKGMDSSGGARNGGRPQNRLKCFLKVQPHEGGNTCGVGPTPGACGTRECFEAASCDPQIPGMCDVPWLRSHQREEQKNHQHRQKEQRHHLHPFFLGDQLPLTYLLRSRRPGPRLISILQMFPVPEPRPRTQRFLFCWFDQRDGITTQLMTRTRFE